MGEIYRPGQSLDFSLYPMSSCMLTVSLDDELEGASRLATFGPLLLLHWAKSCMACSSTIAAWIGPGGLNMAFLSVSYKPSTQFPHWAAEVPPSARVFAANQQARSLKVTFFPDEPLRQVLLAAWPGMGTSGVEVAGELLESARVPLGAPAGGIWVEFPAWVLLMARPELPVEGAWVMSAVSEGLAATRLLVVGLLLSACGTAVVSIGFAAEEGLKAAVGSELVCRSPAPFMKNQLGPPVGRSHASTLIRKGETSRTITSALYISCLFGGLVRVERKLVGRTAAARLQ